MSERRDSPADKVEHESYLDCPLPPTADSGEKIRCECGRIWRFDGRYFVVEGLA